MERVENIKNQFCDIDHKIVKERSVFSAISRHVGIYFSLIFR